MKMRLQQAFFNSSQGPQHREFRKEILQAMRVGVWAPTKRNWIPNFYRQCKLAEPQHREIGFPISTDNASWRGPNTEKLDSQFLQTMQVGGGAPTQKLAESQLTLMCKLGWDNEINFVKISFLSHSHKVISLI